MPRCAAIAWAAKNARKAEAFANGIGHVHLSDAHLAAFRKQGINGGACNPVAQMKKKTDVAQSSASFDWIMGILCCALVAGVVQDGWAHNHGKVDESFFTPWHAML